MKKKDIWGQENPVISPISSIQRFCMEKMGYTCYIEKEYDKITNNVKGVGEVETIKGVNQHLRMSI